MPAAARRSSALAPMPGTVRRGGGCGVLEPSAAEDELLRREAAQVTEPGDDERKGAIVTGDAKVRREAIDENVAADDLRSALAVATPPREEALLLPPCIAERAAAVGRGGICVAEAARGGAEAVILIVDEKKKAAATDGRTGDDKKSSCCRLELLLQPRKGLLLAESAATDETRRVSLLDRRERIRSASLVLRKEKRVFFLK